MITTIINGVVVNGINCTVHNEESLVNDKLQEYKIPMLQQAGVDAGVYIKRESKMNRPGFLQDCEADVGSVDLTK